MTNTPQSSQDHLPEKSGALAWFARHQNKIFAVWMFVAPIIATFVTLYVVTAPYEREKARVEWLGKQQDELEQTNRAIMANFAKIYRSAEEHKPVQVDDLIATILSSQLKLSTIASTLPIQDQGLIRNYAKELSAFNEALRIALNTNDPASSPEMGKAFDIVQRLLAVHDQIIESLKSQRGLKS